MLSTGAVDLEDLVTSDGQPSEVAEAGASLFYTLDHPFDELRRGISTFGSADPYDDPLIAMDVHRFIGSHQIDIGAVEFPDLS